MFPLRDNIPSRTTPFVNYAVIAACGLVFLAQLAEGIDTPSLIVDRYGMIPARVGHPEAEIRVPDLAVEETPSGRRLVETTRPAAPSAVPPWLTMLTCIFLHGGWLHFLGNMWFLFIFGDNVEDRFGHVGYALFYLACGMAASFSHFATDPASSVPTIGASGAIAGVMGAYLFLYPHARVLAIVPLFVIFYSVVLPAPVFLGVWFLIQLYQGVAAFTGTTGVAWWAHIGGFAVGAAVAWLLNVAHFLRPPAQETRSYTTHRVHFR